MLANDLANRSRVTSHTVRWAVPYVIVATSATLAPTHLSDSASRGQIESTEGCWCITGQETPERGRKLREDRSYD
jgi:hypothetical protein